VNRIAIITVRELASYFTTPLAYVFLVIFLILNGVCTFYLGGLYERGQAELGAFFDFHPWLYVLLVSAISMSTWAEERRSGTLELLLTLPVSIGQAVIGKFLAGWLMIATALAFTVPIWITVNYLGAPDNGVILANYLGSWLMAGAYLALGCCLSAATRNQVVAFVLTATVGFLLLIVALPQVLVAFSGVVAAPVVDAIAAMSYQMHFQSIGRDSRSGVLCCADHRMARGNRIDDRAEKGMNVYRHLVIVCTLVAVIAATMLASYPLGRMLASFRIDLTEDRMFTVAPATLQVLGELAQPVHLDLYFSAPLSEGLPDVRRHALRVEELLREFMHIAPARLTLSIHDPEPFSEEEDAARVAGLDAVPVNIAGEGVYLGLVASTEAHREVIRFLPPDREPFLEYELLKLIHSASLVERPVVGLISELRVGPGYDYEQQRATPGWIAIEQLSSLFDVRELDLEDADALAEAQVLVLVHPKDPHAEMDMDLSAPGMPFPAEDPSSNLHQLFAAWGISMDSRRIVGDPQHAMNVNLGPRGTPVRHLGMLSLGPGNLNADDVVSAGIERINLATAGALITRAVDGLTVEPLIQTSGDAGFIVADNLTLLTDPALLREQFVTADSRLTLAARITGRARSAFESAPVLDDDEGFLTEGDINAIVVADTDVLTDILWVNVETFLGSLLPKPWAGNGNFVLNAVDHLAGNTALVGLRAREGYSRPFTRVQALRREADEQVVVKERILRRQLDELDAKLTDLEAQDAEGIGGLTSEQMQLVRDFQLKRVETRRELRRVRRELNREIEALGTRLKLLNIVLAPMLVALLGLMVFFYRRSAVRALSRHH
jgi:ABC-type uncharacterized transport system involved in gliding motility auxiliary subunit/ABC-type transport system involved in cytochrome c biogenesis permease component